MKLLWALGLVMAVLWLVKGLRQRQGSEPVAPRAAAPQPRSGPAARMVRCAHCGVHLPEADALASAGLHYCSEAHRDIPVSRGS